MTHRVTQKRAAGYQSNHTGNKHGQGRGTTGLNDSRNDRADDRRQDQEVGRFPFFGAVPDGLASSSQIPWVTRRHS